MNVFLESNCHSWYRKHLLIGSVVESVPSCKLWSPLLKGYWIDRLLTWSMCSSTDELILYQLLGDSPGWRKWGLSVCVGGVFEGNLLPWPLSLSASCTLQQEQFVLSHIPASMMCCLSRGHSRGTSWFCIETSDTMSPGKPFLPCVIHLMYFVKATKASTWADLGVRVSLLLGL